MCKVQRDVYASNYSAVTFDLGDLVGFPRSATGLDYTNKNYQRRMLGKKVNTSVIILIEKTESSLLTQSPKWLQRANGSWPRR